MTLNERINARRMPRERAEQAITRRRQLHNQWRRTEARDLRAGGRAAERGEVHSAVQFAFACAQARGTDWEGLIDGQQRVMEAALRDLAVQERFPLWRLLESHVDYSAQTHARLRRQGLIGPTGLHVLRAEPYLGFGPLALVAAYVRRLVLSRGALPEVA